MQHQQLKNSVRNGNFQRYQQSYVEDFAARSFPQVIQHPTNGSPRYQVQYQLPNTFYPQSQSSSQQAVPKQNQLPEVLMHIGTINQKGSRVNFSSQGPANIASQSVNYTTNPNPNASYVSDKYRSNQLNSSRPKQTIVNELIDAECEEDIMDRIEVQNNIVENLNDTPNYEQEYIVPAEELEDIRKKRNSDIFHCIIPNFRIEDIFKMQHYRLVRRGGAASVYSLDSNPNTLKLVMDFSHPREKVLNALIDPTNYHLWNQQVDFGNIKLRIYSENTVIAYQKHRAFDNRVRERDFLYIRHLFQKSGVIYMIDKSIEHSWFPPFDYITRGEIRQAIWAFENSGSSSTRVTYMLHMSLQGTLGGNTSLESMIKYLESMAKLSNYLSRNGRIATKTQDYFDVNWRMAVREDIVNDIHYEQFEGGAQFDGKEELYLTAFPNADWHDYNVGQSFTSPEAKQWWDQAPMTYSTNQHFLDNEVFSDYKKHKQTQQLTSNQNRNMSYQQYNQTHPSEDYFSQSNLPDLINYQVKDGSTRRNTKGLNVKKPLTSHAYDTKAISSANAKAEGIEPSQWRTPPINTRAINPEIYFNQQFAETTTRSLPLLPKGSTTSVTIQNPMLVQLQNPALLSQSAEVDNRLLTGQSKKKDKDHIYEGQEIPEPEEKVHIFKDIPIKFAVDGLVILPKEYLKVRHSLSPVKSVFKIFKKSGWKDCLLKDVWELLPTGDLRCINAEALKGQRGVITYILKKFASNLLNGKNIMNISFPIAIFSQQQLIYQLRSFLEFIARNFGFAPPFLDRAAVEDSAVERLKLVSAFFIAYSHLMVGIDKTFNPILGETYQGWINGCPIYCEQVSHHPPVCALLMIGRGYRIFGAVYPKLQLGLNTLRINGGGQYTIRFDRFPKNTIHYQMMDCEMPGVSFGERLFRADGKSKLQHNLGHTYDVDGHFLELTFNPSKKGMFSFGKQSKPVNWVQGSLVKTSPEFVAKFRKDKKRQGPSQKEVSQTIATANGWWTGSIKFDGVEYYNIQRDQPCIMEDEPYPLNSNCCYREDLAYRRKNDLVRAQIQKERLEVLQRNDKKLREKHGKVH